VIYSRQKTSTHKRDCEFANLALPLPPSQRSCHFGASDCNCVLKKLKSTYAISSTQFSALVSVFVCLYRMNNAKSLRFEEEATTTKIATNLNGLSVCSFLSLIKIRNLSARSSLHLARNRVRVLTL